MSDVLDKLKPIVDTTIEIDPRDLPPDNREPEFNSKIDESI